MIIKLAKFKRTFDFIDDEILRHNLALNLQYVTYILTFNRLLEVTDKHLRATNLKAVILFYASIIESVLYHCLEKSLEQSKIDSSKYMKAKFHFRNPKVIAKLDNGAEVVGAIRHQHTIYNPTN